MKQIRKVLPRLCEKQLKNLGFLRNIKIYSGNSQWKIDCYTFLSELPCPFSVYTSLENTPFFYKIFSVCAQTGSFNHRLCGRPPECFPGASKSSHGGLLRAVAARGSGGSALPFCSKRKYVHFSEMEESCNIHSREWTYLLFQ